ncbi:hypothetical protein NQ540_01195 [Granulicatella adiacens ATCC 49175]|jgi:ribonuclease R|uniref:DUF3139 domain-containing protein n=1 Tax=Granulicatella adiacens ATCC 49175 TaxID=638301 RepID=C8NHD0_9LACT|nr:MULTISPECIES: hypothetical protein [Granulicatella]EEW37107.1 hypothetical protein HMPREF0444_1325 [Granulicatella adiacens ATCC 49175]UAK94388.1 hypothetical protein K8O88_03670 [Granulicatella adiacens]UWP38369.1 hypothetical protein NQ540_01195 [Granulicatella adiacens ATCC 49175]
MLGIVIGVILLIFLQALIANITTPKVEIVEDVEYIRKFPKEHYKIDNLKDDIIIGKYHPSGNYYFVVYNEDSKDFDIKKVEEKDWEHQEINRYER